MRLNISFLQSTRPEKPSQADLQKVLVHTICAGNLSGMEVALKAGALPNASSPYGSAPAIHHALYKSPNTQDFLEKSIALLRRYDGDINIADKYGITGYDVASREARAMFFPERAPARVRAERSQASQPSTQSPP